MHPALDARNWRIESGARCCSLPAYFPAVGVPAAVPVTTGLTLGAAAGVEATVLPVTFARCFGPIVCRAARVAFPLSAAAVLSASVWMEGAGVNPSCTRIGLVLPS